MKHVWPIASVLSIGLLLAGTQTSRGEQTIDLTQWMLPDIRTVGDGPFGQLVRYGHSLFTDTANEIGPSVSEPAKRLAGKQSRVPKRGGTQPYAMPMTGVWGEFPQYRAREGMVDTLEERVNGCMQTKHEWSRAFA